MRSFLLASAHINPEQARKYAEELQNEIMPSLKLSRKEQIAKMQSMLKQEENMIYSVKALDGQKPKKRDRIHKPKR